MTQERWLPIPGYEGWYEVSNCGVVRRIKPHPKGRDITGRIKKQVRTKCGYLNCGLNKNGKGKTFGIHVLVASAFLGPCPPRLEVNDINGVRTDNRPKNLEYVTHFENCSHAYRALGRERMSGEKNHMAKATREQVSRAKEMMKLGASKRKVAKLFGRHVTWAFRVASGEIRANG